jgi:hypothetical protein
MRDDYKDDDVFKDEYNPIEDIIERLNYCRADYYKLFTKDFKVASVRLRHELEYVIQVAKQVKRDALSRRKEIEDRKRIAKEEYEAEQKKKIDNG